MPNSVYDLEDIKLPLVSGGLLKLFIAILEFPLTRPLLMGTFLNNAGIPKLRSTHLDEPPTFFPYLSVPKGEPGPEPNLQDLPSSGPEFPEGSFAFTTIWDYATAYREGKTTPLEVAERFLDIYEKDRNSDDPFNGFIAVDHDEVLRQARESTERFKSGNPLSIFDGVPVSVKDELDVTPYPSKLGTSFIGKGPVKEDATIVARLRSAGAIILGKANMHEIGITTNGVNITYGTPTNPYAPGYAPGGSSSGPAALVAGGYSPVGLGADGGGSIRIPPAYCGVVGLKATFGRISEFGSAPLGWSVGYPGPTAATVEDCALTYAVIGGTDPKDYRTRNQPPVTIAGYDNDDLTGLTLGVYDEWFNHADPEIVETCRKMVANLESKGATIKQIEIPELDLVRIAHATIILTEMANQMDRYWGGEYKKFDGNTRILLTVARQFTGRDYVNSQRVRTRAINAVENVLAEVDAILTPTTGITAPKVTDAARVSGESDTTTTVKSMRFIYLTNMTGHPSISFPAGYNRQGHPIGLQVIGRAWEEHTILRIAYAGERFVQRKKPVVHVNLLG